MDEESHRWARADAVLRGDYSGEVGEEVQRVRRRGLVSLVGVAVVLLVGAAVVGVLALLGPDSASRHLRPGHPPVWVEVCGLVLELLGLMVMVLGMRQVLRATGRPMSRWGVPTAQLTWRQRRQLRCEALGLTPVDFDRLPLARDLARRVVAGRWWLLNMAGLFVMVVGIALLNDAAWLYIFLAVLLLLEVGALITMVRNVRRAERFLDLYPG